MLQNTSRILSPRIYSGKICDKSLILVGFVICSFITAGCGGHSFNSPKALLKTFCLAYNSGDDKLLCDCGMADYVIDQIAIEKIDADGKSYYVKVKGLKFEIENIHKGRIGLQKEYSDQRILVTVRFFSDIDSNYERKVTIYMVLKKSSTSAPSKWQIYPLPV